MQIFVQKDVSKHWCDVSKRNSCILYIYHSFLLSNRFILVRVVRSWGVNNNNTHPSIIWSDFITFIQRQSQIFFFFLLFSINLGSRFINIITACELLHVNNHKQSVIVTTVKYFLAIIILIMNSLIITTNRELSAIFKTN